jgi:hypothetical protein
MQQQNQHAKYIFPEKCWGKQVAIKNYLLPNTTRDHDCVER